MFDCLNHDLLIAKLYAYGLGLHAFRLIYDHLLTRKQRARTNNVSSTSTWMEIVFGVPLMSISGSILFKIFLSDFSFTVNSIYYSKYANDKKPYANVNV